MVISFLKKGCIVYMIYMLLSIAFYYIAGNSLHYKSVEHGMAAPESVLEPMVKGVELQEKFISTIENIDQFSFYMATYGKPLRGILYFSVQNTNSGEIAAQGELNAASIKNNDVNQWKLSRPIEKVYGKELLLTIRTDSKADEAPTIFYSNKAQRGQRLSINGNAVIGKNICFSYSGWKSLLFGKYYWQFVFMAGLFIIAYFTWVCMRMQKGKTTLVAYLFLIWKRYKFLIKQLVSRDFKTKYKRSALGYLWSFLNPLLTMGVQYIVFSTLFQSGIKNFPIYLLSGIILFGFFQEAVGQGLMAIVGNAPLITKVYVPKYIYPITKVASSSINLLISMLPLLFVAILTGTRITKAILLIPFALACLIIFCIGMSFILSACMVFFRDTLYLWGIISLAWMYATPLFYPADIIPSNFRIIQTLNPLYYFIKFIRTVLIDGVSPDPMQYLYCLVSATLALLIGVIVFKKTQNKFVLYI